MPKISFSLSSTPMFLFYLSVLEDSRFLSGRLQVTTFVSPLFHQPKVSWFRQKAKIELPSLNKTAVSSITGRRWRGCMLTKFGKKESTCSGTDVQDRAVRNYKLEFQLAEK